MTRQAWMFIQALRSGNYPEGNYRLKWKGRFTPSGVLCDLYLKEHGLAWSEAPWKNRVWKNPCLMIPTPKQPVEWAEIPFETMVKLERLNDKGLHPFPILADHLEKALTAQVRPDDSRAVSNKM